MPRLDAATSADQFMRRLETHRPNNVGQAQHAKHDQANREAVYKTESNGDRNDARERNLRYGIFLFFCHISNVLRGPP